MIKNKVAEWAVRLSEIKETGVPGTPGVRLKLIGVDVDSVVQHAAHRNADNKECAKGLLQPQRGALLKQVSAAFKQAYGLADTTRRRDHRFRRPLLRVPDISALKVSIGQSMRDELRHVLAHQLPAHLDLDSDGTGNAVRPGEARIIFMHV